MARNIEKIINAQPLKEGDGVSIFRSIGSAALTELNPFLLLDEIKSDDANDYIGGFPAHPHRGFETVTYMLAGQMRHRDSVGNEGVIGAGDLQWMTAGSGIIHSEMPEQTAGRLWGFQLWVNLPASEKMRDPRYQEISSSNIPEITFGSTAKNTIRLLAGEYKDSRGQLIQGAANEIVTQPIMFDIHLDSGETLQLGLPNHYELFAYVYKGCVDIGGAPVQTQQLAKFVSSVEASSDAENVVIANKTDDNGGTLENTAGLLLIGAPPLQESIARAGPFVMNSRQELEQAFEDYRKGRLVQ